MRLNKNKRILLGTEETGAKAYLEPASRSVHMQVIGSTNTGKSKFLEHLIRNDILTNEGLCLIDPHGHLYNDLVRWCETKRFFGRKKIALFDPAQEELVFSFNPLSVSAATAVSFHVDAMVKAVSKVWGGEDQDKTPTLKRCLRVIFHILAEKRLSLLEARHLTMPESSEIREYIASNIGDQVIRQEWQRLSSLNDRQFQETFSSTVNRLIEFFSSPIIRNMIGQTERTIDFRKIMDEGHILLVNLASQNKLSDDNARLLGTLIVSDLFVNARARPAHSRPFYLYIDECARYVNEDVSRILDEGRKFGLHLILAHQHLSQLKEAGGGVYSSVMTCANTKVVFGGLETQDAELMAKELFAGELDLEEAKKSLDKPVVVGYEKTVLRNSSWNMGQAQGQSEGSGSVAYAADGELTSVLESSGASYLNSESESEGHSEALRPVLQNLPTQTYSLAEQVYKKGADLKNLPIQHAVVKTRGSRAKFIKVPTIEPGFASDKRVAEFKEKCYLSTEFVKTEKEAQERLEKRLAELTKGAVLLLPKEPATFRDSKEPRLGKE